MGRNALVNDELRQQVVLDYLHGEGPFIIADRYGVSPQTVRVWAREHIKQPGFSMTEDMKRGVYNTSLRSQNGKKNIASKYGITVSEVDTIIAEYQMIYSGTANIDMDRLITLCAYCKPVKVISEDCGIKPKHVIAIINERMGKHGYRRAKYAPKKGYDVKYVADLIYVKPLDK